MSTVAAPEIPNMPFGNATSEEPLESAKAAGAVDGKIAIITGASRGIGRAIALRLAQNGAKILLVARNEGALASVAEEISSVGEAFGALDIVVNNAGATKRGDFLELTDADWLDGFALKFFGAVRLVRAAWPHLVPRRGSVLNIIGIGGRTPGAEFTIGGSVNGAGLSFTKALADIGIRDGVQVNAINPGWVRTDRLRALLQSTADQLGGNMQAAVEQVVHRSNIVRLGEPEDVANLAAFILSAEGRLLQGSLIDLDGGQTKTL